MATGAASPKIGDLRTGLGTEDASYRKLANALPQIVWSADAQGRVQWVNDWWTELTGLSQEESLRDGGWAAIDAVHPDDREELRRCIGQSLASSSPCELQYRIRTRDGDYRFHVARHVPVRDERGTITQWVAVAIDMHDRHQAEEALRASERTFETVFNLSPQPTSITRVSDGVILMVNDAFLKLGEFSREEVVGNTAVGLGIWTLEERARNVAPLFASASAQIEVSCRTKTGRNLTLSLSTARIDFDGEPSLVNVATDVTEQRAAENAMRAADRRKDEFLALLSHELRNPLAPIVTAAELMQMRGDVATPFEREVILRQAQHMVRLVDDLLDVSRVARGKVTLAKVPLELGSVVSKAVEAASPLLEQRRHQLQLSVPSEGLPVIGDEVRLTQVVSNLLTNAARYTRPGGRIDVTAAREGDEVVLRVRDNGAGIDAALLPNVFEMFVQGTRGADRAEGGLGLGLSLVRTLTILHGGSVSAHSEGPGQGSEFTVRLPASAPRPAPPSPDNGATRPAGATRSKRVLVVDDNVDGAQMISSVLIGAGHDVQVVADPSHALLLSDAFRPQVAILDVGLPVMDGYTLGQELRSRLSGEPPLLIALTGYGQTEDRRRSEEAGFSLHLVKPVSAELLLGFLAG